MLKRLADFSAGYGLSSPYTPSGYAIMPPFSRAPRIGFVKRRKRWRRRIYPRPFFYYTPSSKLTMRLQGSVLLTLTGGLNSESHFLRLNSCFDPFGDMGAGQTPWFDEMSAMYNYYMVTSASFRVEHVKRATGDSVKVCIYASRNTPAANYSNASGQVGAKTMIIPHEPRTQKSAVGVFCDFAHQTGSPLDESQDAAPVGRSPTRQMFGHLVFTTAFAGALNADVFQVSLIQNVIFFGRVSPSDV